MHSFSTPARPYSFEGMFPGAKANVKKATGRTNRARGKRIAALHLADLLSTEGATTPGIGSLDTWKQMPEAKPNHVVPATDDEVYAWNGYEMDPERLDAPGTYVAVNSFWEKDDRGSFRLRQSFEIVPNDDEEWDNGYYEPGDDDGDSESEVEEVYATPQDMARRASAVRIANLVRLDGLNADAEVGWDAPTALVWNDWRGNTNNAYFQDDLEGNVEGDTEPIPHGYHVVKAF